MNPFYGGTINDSSLSSIRRRFGDSRSVEDGYPLMVICTPAPYKEDCCRSHFSISHFQSQTLFSLFSFRQGELVSQKQLCTRPNGRCRRPSGLTVQLVTWHSGVNPLKRYIPVAYLRRSVKDHCSNDIAPSAVTPG